MKSGYQTTEFWVTLTSQILGFLVLVHVINPAEQTNLSAALGQAIAAVFTILASSRVVMGYIASRTHLKSQAAPPNGDPFKLFLLPLLILGLAGPEAAAQSPISPNAAPAPMCLLPWRQRVEERLRGRQQMPSVDPSLAQVLQQIAENQRTIISLLERRQAAPAAPMIVLAQPLQQIPLGGMPYQQVPLGGPPKQDVPLGTPPKQDLPLGPLPRQDIPLGTPPKQPLDGGAAPKISVPWLPPAATRSR